MSNVDLKACPFCGSDELTVTNDTDATAMVVKCMTCAAIGPETNWGDVDSSKEAASLAWNIRDGESKRANRKILEGDE